MLHRRSSFAIRAGFLLTFALCSPTVSQATGASPETAAWTERNANDRGIARDPAVMFSDDFEAWTNNGAAPPANTWQVPENSVSRTQVIPGRVEDDACNGPGAGVLEIACWTEGSGLQSGGVSFKLGNYNYAREGLGDGYDEVYVRYYIRYDEEYRAVQRQYVGPLASAVSERDRVAGHDLTVFHADQGPDQNPNAVARIVKLESTSQPAAAPAGTLDFTFGGPNKKGVRRDEFVCPIHLQSGRNVLIVRLQRFCERRWPFYAGLDDGE